MKVKVKVKVKLSESWFFWTQNAKLLQAGGGRVV